MMKNDAMLDALRKKKGQGLDLTIMLGDMGMEGDDIAKNGADSDADESEKLGLAPDTMEKVLPENEEEEMLASEMEEGMEVPTEEEVIDPSHADEEQDKALFRKLLQESRPSTNLGKMALASLKK